MKLYRVLLLACVSFSAFANPGSSEKKCAAAVWGIASPLNLFSREDLGFFRWRAERLQLEIGHWLSDPAHYNQSMAPALGLELEEAFAHSPSPYVYKTQLQSLFRVAGHWLALIEFIRLFRAPLFELGPNFTRSQLSAIWQTCENRTRRDSAHSPPGAPTDIQVRTGALAIVEDKQVPHYLRSFIKMHLDVMDYYELSHAQVLGDLVRDLQNTYKIAKQETP